ncbi:RICIN domain-containing protein [Streptosporangium roseum]|uniref:Pectate lyase-like protein n=1 Tax=Streptosporangium roseum (strain ATCC 12428 / DSM 43021 / JCM 3005 / KCTC 9067 / NCIMB 10171 / NRRL 2505 / NI 9100) TaxID=479432 RepID=D2B793_STRRD|nr:RICIN domain-containing protein [Streptosporangium roseum]ACZ89618.1 Pectate lyase-like protein [Streptosporangium roseum DSM 43021]
MKRRISGKAATAVITGTVVVSGLAVGVSVASAAPAPGTYTLVNAASGLCLAVPGGSTSDGVQLVQNGCDGAAGQAWSLTAAGSGFQLKATHSGKCAGVKDASTSAGKAVQQEGCSGAASQTWQLTQSGTDYRVVNANGGKCLNTKDNATSAGALVQQNSCDSVATKQWRLVPAGSGPSPTVTPTATPTVTPPPGSTGGLVGWATQGGGTTGGGGTAPVTVTSASALTSALSSAGAAVIRVSGTISCSGMLKVTSDKTVLGNSGATIAGCGLNISEASNVIVRNLNFRGWDDDGINVQYSTRVWLDHNSFSDGYDGALDIKRASDYVTVSWNRFFDHDKTMLLGHSDGNGGEDSGHLRVTYHHNWFDGTNQRHPRVRFGNPVHVYNNYYAGVGSGGGYGVASTEGAGVLVEGNYFENTADPYHRGEGSSDPGSLVARNNHSVNSGAGDAGGSVAAIPYAYSLDPAANVKSVVSAGAGAGRIAV